MRGRGEEIETVLFINRTDFFLSTQAKLKVLKFFWFEASRMRRELYLR